LLLLLLLQVLGLQSVLRLAPAAPAAAEELGFV
jgi:hypothetical protein